MLEWELIERADWHTRAEAQAAIFESIEVWSQSATAAFRTGLCQSHCVRGTTPFAYTSSINLVSGKPGDDQYCPLYYALCTHVHVFGCQLGCHGRREPCPCTGGTETGRTPVAWLKECRLLTNNFSRICRGLHSASAAAGRMVWGDEHIENTSQHGDVCLCWQRPASLP